MRNCIGSNSERLTNRLKKINKITKITKIIMLKIFSVRKRSKIILIL